MKQSIFLITNSQLMLWEILARKLIGVLRLILPSATWMLIKLMWGKIFMSDFTCFRSSWLLFHDHSNLHLFSGQNIVADMRKVLAKNPHIEQQRLHRRVFLENINPENQALQVNILLLGIWALPHCLSQLIGYSYGDINLVVCWVLCINKVLTTLHAFYLCELANLNE